MKSTVYTLEKKKKQIDDFSKKRNENVVKLVRDLIVGGKYESFEEISDETEAYLKKQSANYISDVRCIMDSHDFIPTDVSEGCNPLE